MNTKLSLTLSFIVALGFLCDYTVSVYIHRNDGRFQPSPSERLIAIDTRTGRACYSIPVKGDVFDQLARKDEGISNCQK
jgi:hypothetical protein